MIDIQKLEQECKEKILLAKLQNDIEESLKLLGYTGKFFVLRNYIYKNKISLCLYPNNIQDIKLILNSYQKTENKTIKITYHFEDFFVPYKLESKSIPFQEPTLKLSYISNHLFIDLNFPIFKELQPFFSYIEREPYDCEASAYYGNRVTEKDRVKDIQFKDTINMRYYGGYTTTNDTTFVNKIIKVLKK